MANMQQNEKRKFNVIDLFIIILVLLCVLGIVFRSQVAELIGVEKHVEEYKLSFKVSEIRYTSDKYFQAGSKVYLNSGEALLGTIDGNCTILPAQVYVDGPDGVPVKVNCPEDTYIDVMGVIKCLGIEKDGGFYLGGTYAIVPRSEIKVHTEMMDFVITVTEISK